MMAAPRPLPVTPPGLLDDEDPGKWEKLKQVLWESNLNAPVRGIYNLMNTPYDVLMGGEGPEFDQAVADSFDAAGGITVGSMPMPKPSNSVSMGIKAYHGSPHSFDKFSMDKIGTGEGAQAYGHGLYFAESEGVAKSYRDALSKSIYKFNKDPAEIAKTHGQEVVDTIYNHEGDPKEIQKTIARLRDAVNRDLAEFGVSDVSQLKPMYDGDLASKTIQMARNADSLEAAIKSGDIALDPGSMYEVDINADPNAFLDWDKPLSEQPEVAKRLGYSSRSSDAIHDEADALFTEYGPYPDMPDHIKTRIEELQKELDSRVPNMTGEQYYTGNWDNDYLHSTLRGEKFTREQSDELAKKGIPGIKYLDAGSRGKGVAHVQPMYKGKPYGDPIPATAWNQVDQLTQRYKDMGYDVEVKDLGTRNYVVFDDSLIDIIKKYGIAGLLGGGGLYGMSGDEAQAGAY